jgi:hypothetical protein
MAVYHGYHMAELKKRDDRIRELEAALAAARLERAVAEAERDEAVKLLGDCLGAIDDLAWPHLWMRIARLRDRVGAGK